MAIEKKFLPQLPEFSIRPKNRDLSKTWYIDFKVAGQRLKKYGDINKYHTLDKRLQAAEKLIEELHTEYFKRESLIFKMIRFLENNKGRWRPKTYSTYKSRLFNLVEWLNGREVSSETLIGFFNHLTNSRHKSTYNAHRQLIGHLLKGVGEEEMIMPIARLRNHMTPDRYYQTYQAKRLARLMQERDEELWLFIQFVYYCFIRPNSELRLLRVGDILWEDSKIVVRGEVSKNYKTEYVVIPDAFLPALEHLKHRDPNEWLFPSKRDKSKPIGYNTMYDRHRKLLKELNFGKGYTVYSWKHTGAVSCVKAGISIKELQIQLRHSSLEEVDRYLRQLGVADLRKLRSKFPSITSPKSPQRLHSVS